MCGLCLKAKSVLENRTVEINSTKSQILFQIYDKNWQCLQKVSLQHIRNI